MSSKDQRGFGAVQALILVAIAGLVGGTVWYVWHIQSTNKTTSTTTQPTILPSQNTEKPTKPPTAPDPTDDWTAFSSAKGKFSLKYPKKWVQPVNRDACSPGLFDRAVYLGPDAESVLVCASEFFGQMSVISVDGDKRADSDLGSDYKDIVKKDVTVNDITGQRISGVAKAPAADAVFGPLEGTTEVHYVFYVPATGMTYTARYTQAPAGHAPGTNVLSDFDLMITKTLKFSS